MHFELERAPYDVDLVDLDLDGTLDVVATLRLRQLAIVRTDGAGGFVAPRYVSTGIFALHSSVAEIDGDGRPDLVVYPHGGGDGVLFLNRTERVREAR